MVLFPIPDMRFLSSAAILCSGLSLLASASSLEQRTVASDVCVELNVALKVPVLGTSITIGDLGMPCFHRRFSKSYPGVISVRGVCLSLHSSELRPKQRALRDRYALGQRRASHLDRYRSGKKAFCISISICLTTTTNRSTRTILSLVNIQITPFLRVNLVILAASPAQMAIAIARHLSVFATRHSPLATANAFWD